MANTRKQRYRLDIDDVLSRAFLTKPNADELVLGLNESTTTQKLALQVGGTNNPVWIPDDDKHFVIFDNATKSLKPSTYTEPVGLQSIQIPYITGAVYKNDGVNSFTDSATAIDLASQTFTLPPISHWVDIHLVFQFTLQGIAAGAQHVALSSLKVLLGSDSDQAETILGCYPEFSTTAVDDTNTVTWVAIGEIPAAHQLDSTLTVKVNGIPHDIGVRACVTRVGYRGSVDISPVLAKGVLVPIAQTTVKARGGAVAWTTFNIPDLLVPATASAIILTSFAKGDDDAEILVEMRPSVGASSMIINRAAGGPDDSSKSFNQGMFPFASLNGHRSFQYHVTGNEWAEIHLVAYLS